MAGKLGEAAGATASPTRISMTVPGSSASPGPRPSSTESSTQTGTTGASAEQASRGAVVPATAQARRVLFGTRGAHDDSIAGRKNPQQGA